MPLHHFLPATYLAGFSKETTFPRRNRKLAVRDQKDNSTFVANVSNVGGINNYYIIQGLKKDGDGLTETSIDDIWSDYESNLSYGIQDLLQRSITAETWLRVLVPFATCILLRSPDFSPRFTSRLNPYLIKQLDDDPDFNIDSMANMARLMEIQRLLAPILASKWVIYSVPKGLEIATNDIGYVPIKRKSGFSGFFIPLTRKRILALIPSRRRPLLIYFSGTWFPVITQDSFSKEQTEKLNHQVAESAMRFVIGSSETFLSGINPTNFNPLVRPDIDDLGLLTSVDRRVHEFTWHRLVSILEKAPNEASNFSELFVDTKGGWYPPVSIPSNLPMFKPGLYVHGDACTAVEKWDTI